MATAGVTSLGTAKGFPYLLLSPSWFFRPVGWTMRSKLSVPRTWRRRSTRGKQRGSIQPGWKWHPSMLTAGRGHCSLLPTLGEIFSWMGWSCHSGWGLDGGVFPGRDGSGNVLWLGCPALCKEPNTCRGQPGPAVGLSPCSSGGHPDKTFCGILLTQQTEEKRNLTQNRPRKRVACEQPEFSSRCLPQELGALGDP